MTELKNTIENKLKERKTAGGVVINSEGDILLAQQKESGFWTFPKGGIDEASSEVALAAAIREIWEESGIEEKDLERVGNLEFSYDRPDTEKEGIIQKIVMYLFRSMKTELNIPPEFQDEIGEARWAKIGEVANLLTAPKDREFFLEIQDKIQEALREVKSEIRNS